MSVNYKIVDDFNSVDPNPDQLFLEIQADVNITTTILSVRSDEINVYIIFETEIIQSEKDALDIIVSNHVPTIETNKILRIIPRVWSVKNSTYRRIASFYFPGSNYATANVVSRMVPGITSYDIRIIDRTRGEVLLTKNLNNTEESRQELGPLSNLSTEPTIFQILVKKNGGNYDNRVLIENINIEYVSSRL